MTVNVFGRRLPASASYVALLGAGVILLLVTVIAAFWQADAQREHSLAVQASFEIRADLRQFMIAMQDAETGQRGFLLTREDTYLAPYDDARQRALAEIESLSLWTETTPRLVEPIERMRSLATQKFGELQTTIGLTQSGQFREAMQIVRGDSGKQVMDELRQIVASELATEGASLASHLTEAERGSLMLRGIVLLAAILLVGVGVLLVFTAQSAVAELRSSRDTAEAANERLIKEIGSRQKAEAKVVQMQKMEAIGQLTGGVAHDFNNMLAVIIGALSLMRRKLERGESDLQRYLDAADDGARRAATLTNRLLAFARRSALSPVTLDVNQLVGSISELLRRTLGEQVRMETVLAGGLWNVNADPSQLENALVNICVNARDAMPEGGKLTLETANAHLDDAYAAANPDVTAGQYVLIAVTDTGAGMTSDVVSRVFEPFFTTKDVGKGTGLGLSHVHGFLKQSGGHVSIYSEVDHGTTVKLYLPRTTKSIEAAEPAPQSEAAPAGESGTLILVVEDEDRVRSMTVAALRELGYTVVHAESGTTALEKLETHPGVSLLFTDIVMPDMSGRKLADAARERYTGLRVLFTTGYTQNAIVHNGVVDADARLLMKPFSVDDLARKVRAVLDEK